MIVCEEQITKHKSAVPKVLLKCKRCGCIIPKDEKTTWRNYSKRTFCSHNCSYNRDKKAYIPKGELPLSVYIGDNTKGGRLIANLYIGVLQAFDEGKEYYKTVEITTDLVKVAAEWLTLNFLGKPGQRREDVKEPRRSREELMSVLRSIEAKYD